MKTTSVQKVVVLLTLVSLLGASCAKSKPDAPTAERKELATAASGCGQPTFKIDPKSQTPPWMPPTDIPGGAASASLQSAAVFAWQEFIALNWPALPQNGQLNTRDQPDPNALFGDPKYSGAQAAGPLVWHTFRHKAEIFPGTLASPTPPHGYVNNPAQYYGYDDPPQYIYTPNATAIPSMQQWIIPPSGTIPPFGSASSSTPWINLDEQSEIGLDAMFAGNAPTSPFPGQEILFMAKANRAEYTYIATNGWWVQTFDASGTKILVPPITATGNYIASFAGNPSAYVDPPPGSSQYVSFPNNTIEVKSGWRQLTTAEMNSGRFYTTTVRFYNAPSTGPNAGQIGYVDAVWGLVALHIIQKTQTAPYFIYATFSQADNLLDANGNQVEDVNGNLLENGSADPLEPNVVSQNATSAPSPTQQSVQQLSPATSTLTPAQVGSRIFFTNTPTTPAPPPTTQGMVALNRREHNIPQCIIDVNTAVHGQIIEYGQLNNLANPVWQYYKLVSVQYQPYDKPAGTTYSGAPGGPDPAIYYQSNEVVESDYNLQVFSGRFQNQGTVSFNVMKLITDFTDTGTPFQNVFYSNYTPGSGQAANMGGCMGCHGNAQNAGGDFSFILLGGPVGSQVGAPEVATGPYSATPPPATPSARLSAKPSTNSLGATAGVKRFRKLLLRSK